MTVSTGRGVIPQFTRADRLRKAREHAGLYMRELADELGVSESTISRYEGGGQRARRAVVMAWAVATGVDFAWLFDGDDHAAASQQPAGGIRKTVSEALKTHSGTRSRTPRPPGHAPGLVRPQPRAPEAMRGRRAA